MGAGVVGALATTVGVVGVVTGVVGVVGVVDAGGDGLDGLRRRTGVERLCVGPWWCVAACRRECGVPAVARRVVFAPPPRAATNVAPWLPVWRR